MIICAMRNSLHTTSKLHQGYRKWHQHHLEATAGDPHQKAAGQRTWNVSHSVHNPNLDPNPKVCQISGHYTLERDCTTKGTAWYNTKVRENTGFSPPKNPDILFAAFPMAFIRRVSLNTTMHLFLQGRKEPQKHDPCFRGTEQVHVSERIRST